MEQEEPRQPQRADHLELLLQPSPRLPVLGLARVAVIEPRPADLGQRPVGVGVLRARVAVAEVAGEVEARAARRSARSPRPRPGARAKRAAIAAGAARWAEPFPRRSGSVSSSVPFRRTATSASWSGAREGSCMWTSPVATHRTPSRSARSSSQRLRARSDRQNGRCSSTRKRSRPKAPTSRRPSASAAAASAARGLPPARPKSAASAPSRAQPERQTSPSARCSSSVEREGGGEGLPVRARAGIRVSLGDQPAEVPPPGGVLDQQRQVKRGAAPASSRSARRRRSGARRTPCTPGRTPSPPRRRRGRSARGPVAQLGRRQRQLLRRRRPVEEGVGGVAVELDVITPATPARGRLRGLRLVRRFVRGRGPSLMPSAGTSARSAGSRKTTTLRPSASTSSK